MMIVKAIFIGNAEEAYINEAFKDGLNIISSDDNNKGKTIVIQSIMYCMGNIPAFPTLFEYKKYYHILYIEHNQEIFKICRKDKNFVIKKGEEYAVFDTVAEFKRYWNKNIEELPVIKKANVSRIADPELYIQTFFVGQDKKITYNIVNKGWYKKEDFYNILYYMNGIHGGNRSVADVEKVKNKIKELKSEKNLLFKENQILKKSNAAFEFLSATNDRVGLENTLKEVERIKNKLLNLRKGRNNAISRRTKNEMAMKELRSLNRTMKTGQIACLDCGSKHIAYESGDSEFSFDISTSAMRQQILSAVQEKIEIYNEEIVRLTNEITLCQQELDSCMETEDVPLEVLLIIKQEMDGAKGADSRISEIDAELKKLSAQLETKEAISDDIEKRCKKLIKDFVNEMNSFYQKVDLAGKNVYDDIFTTQDKIYSGSEATEFHLARMYAFCKVLQHKYPIIIDSFRAEDLSSDREERVLEIFKELPNQIIFTTTLKKEEGAKYTQADGLNNIDFSNHITNKMLADTYIERFMKSLNDILVIAD